MTTRRLRVQGQSFRDPQNREIILRGVNLAGDLRSHDHQHFLDADNVSFVGRPFPLEHADAHFQRLRRLGYNTIRYTFTWEAIEHAGPGRYDTEWVEFTVEILRIAKKYQFYIFMEPYQDFWSRLSGGSGAPAWTFYAAGLNPESFQNTEAALSQRTPDLPADSPKVPWCTSYTRLACQTMFTLFWAGRDFAPKAIINGVNIQDYLQGHFIAACKYLAQKIHDADGLDHDVVIGWESLNEPHKGLIGIHDISKIPPDQHLQLGTSPTAFQGMLLGSGRPCEVITSRFGRFGPRQTGRKLIGPKGDSAWLRTERNRYGWTRDPGWKLGECLWAQHGVWDPANNSLLQKDYFSRKPGDKQRLSYERFTNTYFLGHYRAYRDSIRSVCQGLVMFCQPPVMEAPPSLKGTPDDDPNMVHAVHFYDDLALMTKHWNQLFNIDVLKLLRGQNSKSAFAGKSSEESIRKKLREKLRYIRDESLRNVGHHPLVFTGVGIPYDLDNENAHETGGYRSQIKVMDAYHCALEGSSANGFIMWADMTEDNDQAGDQRNNEDLELLESHTSRPLSSISLDSSHGCSTEQSMEVDPHVQNLLDMWYMSIRQDAKVIMPRTYCDQSQELAPQRRGYRPAIAYLRPSPVRVNGKLDSHGFDMEKCTFTMTLTAEGTVSLFPSVIYLPYYYFTDGETKVTVSGGQWKIVEQDDNNVKIRCLLWWHGKGTVDILIEGKHKDVWY